MLHVYQSLANDCFRCCVASLLELPAVHVPNFMTSDNSDKNYVDHQELTVMDDWFFNRNMRMLRFPVPADRIGDALRRASILQPRGTEYIIGGLTIKGVGHANVARGDLVVHDPAQPIQPLYAPFSGGFFMTYFIGRK